MTVEEYPTCIPVSLQESIELPYVIDEPDKTGHRELRLQGGIVGWIQMDTHWEGSDRWIDELMHLLNFVAQGGMNALKVTKGWAEAHHTKCEDICGAECVPSEDEVRIFQESNHEIRPWEVD